MFVMFVKPLNLILVFFTITVLTVSSCRSSKSRLSFEEEALAQHNIYRKKHGVPKMKLDPKITRLAQDWANHLALTNSWEHSPNNNYGENIYMSYGKNVMGKDAVDDWYSESKLYKDYKNDPTISGYPKSSTINHFTQIVWKGSKRLGVAKATSRSGNTYVVANYSPAGNSIGEYVANVLPPRA